MVDLRSGKARRVLVDQPSLLASGVSAVVGGKTIRTLDGQGQQHALAIALDPVTIDPEYQWVYFGAMTGSTLYRIPAAVLADEQSSDAEKARAIETYGPKVMSDGISIDSAGNVYVSDLAANAVGVTSQGRYRTLVELPAEASWPDGFAFSADGWVYLTMNQLDRTATLNGGQEQGVAPYRLVRFRPLAPGAIGR